MVEQRREQIVRAAWLYHERGMTQQEVAARLHLSRSTVSRLLTMAEEEGIVRTVVTEALPESARLAEEVIERYALRGATVEIAIDEDSPMDAAARAMAKRLTSLVIGGSVTIASGWGRTLARAAQLAGRVPTSGVHLIDAFGHTTTAEMTAAVEVTNALASKFGARVTHLPSPGFAKSAEVAERFFESDAVRHVLDLARAADTVMLAVGVVGEHSLLIEGGFLTAAEMAEVMRRGAVGEVFGLYFDADGTMLDPQPLSPISLSVADLRAAPRVIAAVGGADKVAAVRGAIAAGLVNELAMDETLAEALLTQP